MGVRGLSCVELDQFSRTNRLAVLDVWAPSCHWCQPVSDALDHLSQQFGDQISFAKLNADECWEKVQSLDIMGLPTVLLFKDGRVVDRIIGAYPERYFEERLQRLL